MISRSRLVNLLRRTADAYVPGQLSRPEQLALIESLLQAAQQLSSRRQPHHEDFRYYDRYDVADLLRRSADAFAPGQLSRRELLVLIEQLLNTARAIDRYR
jgi:hypothetical protein